MVQAGLADPREFKMLSGYAGWGPGQLEAEVADGSWWVVAASVPVLQSAIRESPALTGTDSCAHTHRHTDTHREAQAQYV
jgi:hypothetical protein